MQPLLQRRPAASRPSSACGARTARCAGASARRRRASTAPARSCASAASPIDITDRKEAEERQALLAREVDHRAKNALALVQSIVRLTTAEQRRDLRRGRSRAASRRCRARTRCCRKSRWQGADLGRLVDEELAPYRTGARGPDHRSPGPNVLLRADHRADARARAARARHQCRQIRRAVVSVGHASR